MISEIITAVSTAFGRVINLVSGFFGGAEEGGVFGAISDLSSNVFGA